MTTQNNITKKRKKKKNNLAVFLPALIIFILFGLVFWFIISSDNGKNNKQITHSNFILLLDLSDRLQKNKEQSEKDKVIINGVFDLFEKEVNKKLSIRSKDMIRVIIAPQPEINYNTFKLSENLEVNMESIKAEERFDAITTLKKTFLNSVDSLYESADQNKLFVGADIWDFFNSSVDNYVSPDKKNYIFILTDGYLNFNKNYQNSRLKSENKTTFMEISKFRNNPNWETAFNEGKYGLYPVNKKIENTEIYMLEIAPNDIRHPEDYNIICKYWGNWFEELGIEKYKFYKTNDAPIQTVNNLKTMIK